MFCFLKEQQEQECLTFSNCDFWLHLSSIITGIVFGWPSGAAHPLLKISAPISYTPNFIWPLIVATILGQEFPEFLTLKSDADAVNFLKNFHPMTWGLLLPSLLVDDTSTSFLVTILESFFSVCLRVVTYAQEDSKLKSQSCRRRELSRASRDAMRRSISSIAS